MAKYAAGQNEGKQVTLPSTEDKEEVSADAHYLFNIKIPGQRMHHLNQHPHALARELALTEMVWYTMRFPFVSPSTDFTHASTKPPEYTAAVVEGNQGQHARNLRDGGGGLPRIAENRLPFEPWRHFRDSQITCIVNYQTSDFYLDKTSSFSLRPPELLMVCELELYLRWFTTDINIHTKLNENVQLSHWVDGAGRCVRIEQAHIADVANYIHRYTTSPDANLRHVSEELFASIFGPLYYEDRFSNHGHDHAFSELYLRFVDTSKTKRNVVVFTSPPPSYMPNFLIHLLLTMDKFVTEDELYEGPTITDALYSAEIFPSRNIEETHIQNLARRYIVEQLLWLPLGSRTFSLRLKQLTYTWYENFIP